MTVICSTCGESYETDSDEQVGEMLERYCPNCRPPYPWCSGAPTVADCIKAGFCKRNPSCGE